MNWLYFIVSCSWLVFWLYWLVAARRSGIAVVHADVRGALVPLLTVAATILLAILRLLKLKQSFHVSALETVGVVIIYSGLFMAIWARVNLGSSWDRPVTTPIKLHLVTRGPYRLVRHPIYTGLNLAVLGSALVFGGPWFIILAIGLAFAVHSSFQEEKILTEKLPREYSAYKRRTKMCIPYVI